MAHWKDKSAIVCGASAGLGRVLANQLAEQQVRRLALVARSKENLQTLRSELLLKHPQMSIDCLTADLCQRDQVQQVAEHIQQQFGSLDLVIQAVGQSDRGRLLDLTGQRMQELLSANVLASLHAIQVFSPLMGPVATPADRAQSKPGTIVLIGSLASLFAPRYLGGYAIAKHALAALAQQARLELADQGLHVMLACPGPIARNDSGQRYKDLTQNTDLPDSARQPGGGARVRGLNAQRLAGDILAAAARRSPLLIRPRRAQVLHWLSALSCRLGDRLLRKNSG